MTGNQTKLTHIFKQLYDYDGYYDSFRGNNFDTYQSTFLMHIHVEGEKNKSLRLPKEPSQLLERKLTGEETVFGDVLIFKREAETGRELLFPVSSLTEAEKIISKRSGIFHSFRTKILVFDKGKLRPFSISFTDQHGHKVVFENEKNNKLFYTLVESGFTLDYTWEIKS